MTVHVIIRIEGDVSGMSQAESAVAAIRTKAAQSTIHWTVNATYEE